MNASSTLERARAYVAKIPGAVSGSGGHNQTFVAATTLVQGFALDEADAWPLLAEYNQRCSPPWSERELRHKLTSAMQSASVKPHGYLQQSNSRSSSSVPSAGRNCSSSPISPSAAIEKFLNGGRFAEADFISASPWKLPKSWHETKWHEHGVYLSDALFEPGERINFVAECKIAANADGASRANPVGRGVTLERAALEARLLKRVPQCEGGCWLRMNPLDGDGIGDANVTSFRFVLIEFDTLPRELQLSLLAKLPLGIAAIITSGGKSVHAWVRVDCSDLKDYQDTTQRLFNLMSRFGVDVKNKNASRLSRMPGARRTIGAVGDGRQRLLYLNPEPSEKSIFP